VAGHVVHFDHTFAPFGRAVLDGLGLCPGDRVIDIGCGVGATTLPIASIIVPVMVVGVDISVTTLDAARARASATGCVDVEFWHHDVQDGPLEAASFGVASSRFGVMLFPERERALAFAGGRSRTFAGRSWAGVDSVSSLPGALGHSDDPPARGGGRSSRRHAAAARSHRTRSFLVGRSRARSIASVR